MIAILGYLPASVSGAEETGVKMVQYFVNSCTSKVIILMPSRLLACFVGLVWASSFKDYNIRHLLKIILSSSTLLL